MKNQSQSTPEKKKNILTQRNSKCFQEKMVNICWQNVRICFLSFIIVIKKSGFGAVGWTKNKSNLKSFLWALSNCDTYA